jgi:hypothetical protein
MNRNTITWQEQFNREFPGGLYSDADSLAVDYTGKAQNFISQEIVEKLIDDIPDDIPGRYGTINFLPELKQQLKKDWLND